jgi:hypothetical protein
MGGGTSGSQNPHPLKTEAAAPGSRRKSRFLASLGMTGGGWAGLDTQRRKKKQIPHCVRDDSPMGTCRQTSEIIR